FFTLYAPDIQSTVHLEPMELAGVPPGAVSTKLHSQTTADGQSVAWDVALVTGYTRGVLVTAQYTPGPQGGAFDQQLASALPALYQAQVDRLNAI
ncbi:MAG: hypothetical protein QOH57_3442, partial [Mycobacterium sp.]|nr:hypothetical protein [Mycobacterium sp.]